MTITKEMLIEKISYMSNAHKIYMGLLSIAMLMTLASVFLAKIKNMNPEYTFLNGFFIVILICTFFVYKDSQKV